MSAAMVISMCLVCFSVCMAMTNNPITCTGDMPFCDVTGVWHEKGNECVITMKQTGSTLTMAGSDACGWGTIEGTMVGAVITNSWGGSMFIPRSDYKELNCSTIYVDNGVTWYKDRASQHNNTIEYNAAADMMQMTPDFVMLVEPTQGKLCASIPGGKPATGMNVILRMCNDTDPSQTWLMDSISGQIQTNPAVSDDVYCITTDRSMDENNDAQLMPCRAQGDSQQFWTWVQGGSISTVKIVADAEPADKYCLEHHIGLSGTNFKEYDQLFLVAKRDGCNENWTLKPVAKSPAGDAFHKGGGEPPSMTSSTNSVVV